MENLFYDLSKQAEKDVKKIAYTSPGHVGKVPWPQGVTLASEDERGVQTVTVSFDQAPDQKLAFHRQSEEKDLRICWDFCVERSGVLTAVPRPHFHFGPASPLTAQLMKMAGLETFTYQLSEPLAPFLPEIAFQADDEHRGVLSDAGEGEEDVRSLWGYVSEVQAFRAALIDELKKPL